MPLSISSRACLQSEIRYRLQVHLSRYLEVSLSHGTLQENFTRTLKKARRSNTGIAPCQLRAG